MTPVRGDTTCVDAAAASAAAERLITADRVNAIVGGDCSGVTTAMLQNVAMPNGVVMISPSATSPALSTLEDNGLFFRTAPSDARQGQVIAEVLKERGVGTIAITYTNNDYGKGLADSVRHQFQGDGRQCDHRGRAMRTARATTRPRSPRSRRRGRRCARGRRLSRPGRQGASSRARSTPAPSRPSCCRNGMIGDSLVEAIGADLNGSFGTVPGTDSTGGRDLRRHGGRRGLQGWPLHGRGL